MPYEVVFNQEPNFGSSKKFAELVNNEVGGTNEIEMAVDDFLPPENLEKQIEDIGAIEKALTASASSNKETNSEVVVSNSEANSEANSEIVVSNSEANSETVNSVQKISKIRANVNNKQAKAAEAMSKKHDHKRNKRTIEFEEGEAVSVLIPPIDRGGSQLPRAPGVVSRVMKERDLYEICTKFGVLKDCLRAGDLETYHGVIDFDYTSIKNKISLREVSTKLAGRDKDLKEIEVSCQCTGKCSDNRCSCFLAGLACNSHCHSKKAHNCENDEKDNAVKKRAAAAEKRVAKDLAK
jgi:hypothetical protein